MTEEEFLVGYAQRSGVTVEELLEEFIAMPCLGCDYEGCEGWQLITHRAANAIKRRTDVEDDADREQRRLQEEGNQDG